MPTCPNDGAELKQAMFGSNRPYTVEAVEFIHTFTDSKATGYCEKCGPPLLNKARYEANARYQSLTATLNKYIHSIPLLSLQQPEGWKAKPLGLVTGQSVTGTGVFSEFASSWTDFFGSQSKAYNQKIAGGEAICQTQLRAKCFEMGGNAILAVDIDYAEVGGDKGMLMVCMTGTAMLLENTEVMGAKVIEDLSCLTEATKNRQAINRFASIIKNVDSHRVTEDVK
ncbi:MAG: heavy metal-binding domain-containing protein [Hymenobacter sp.]|nr:MAG: heavy metal-binding domain-containing protein [Hymenobacter sp.]